MITRNFDAGRGTLREGIYRRRPEIAATGDWAGLSVWRSPAVSRFCSHWMEVLEMKIKPLADRILVKRIGEQEKTKGGIIIPDTAKEKPQEGKVVAIGRGKTLDDGQVVPLEVKEGDRILFGKYPGTEVKIKGEEHLIMREDDVLGIIG
jgi:chaperonin GroES